MKPLCVVDTNVIVAALLTGREDAATVRLLQGMLSGEIRFVLSVALIAEYRAVLLRPRIQERHGLPERSVDEFLTALIDMAVIREPMAAAPAPDRGDQHLWDLLAVAGDACLVTGDRLLSQAPPPGVSVLQPASFLALAAMGDPT